MQKKPKRPKPKLQLSNKKAQTVFMKICVKKINLNAVDSVIDIEQFQSAEKMSEASADERIAAAVSVFMKMIQDSSQKVERLDKSLLDYHIARIDEQLSRQLDEILHNEEFQKIESAWRGLKFLVDRTDFRHNVKIEILDVSKEDLIQDFEDAPEIVQSGLYRHTYSNEYDTPGGEPIGAVISNYEFDRSPQDIGFAAQYLACFCFCAYAIYRLGRCIFLRQRSMEEVAAIQDLANYMDRAEYIKWKSFRETDDARYIGLTLPRFLARLPYGSDTVPVRSFNYEEQVKGTEHNRYLWANASSPLPPIWCASYQ